MPLELSPERAKAYALRLLGAREYSQARLTEKLVSRGATPMMAKTIVGECVRLGLVDDDRLAQTLIRVESTVFHHSRRAVLAKLVRRGLALARAKEALDRSETNEAVAARHRARAWRRRHPGCDPLARQKLAGYLYRQGFSAKSVRAALADDAVDLALG